MMARVAVNGVYLNVEERGVGLPLLLLHGFTGSTATWEPFLDGWSGFRCLAVDLLGHGLSDAPLDPERYGPERSAADLVALMDQLAVDQAAVLGYSMGGRLAFTLALQAPERVRLMILESVSSGIEDGLEQKERASVDEALACSIESKGLEWFVKHWEEKPLFASQARLPTSAQEKLREQRLCNDPKGLANSLRGMGVGHQQSLHSQIGVISAPILLVAGRDDHKYCRLARRIVGTIPDSLLEIVPKAGHAVHLERPGEFSMIVSNFLRKYSHSVNRRINNGN